MELLQEQIFALTKKVEVIYRIIEQLNDKVSNYIIIEKVNKYQTTETGSNLQQGNELQEKYDYFNPELEHKDVLVDDNYLNKGSQNIDGELTSNIQIQRLTAQLTAAYNRIASLEEQLLSKKIKF
ncbi:MAG: hypothetical protein O4861_05665 [Trichodesmium sp. St16_bin4-tuft]|nr:hypothetical protein [Trichodesmium sp. MAG_R01]MDE5068336.1 hypothetical protein [Trichodesmium sp. St4_bin8_1]MDE5074307.1 hypothetical protein [Trichodesmium sp. St5_bin8]MDE5079572.1 hypothetical protein [Trichodesmium sp. St2_bin6]MDE5097851.1 hypothetical protein [Trichodesmium sp. St16_bin4-tuft]MDE5102532.1 hypothetical protein [Trichodesmium sp. St19_bin2]